MKNRIVTISFREIKKNFKRFLSLAILSFLGVTVFVGIKMGNPDMMTTLDRYYDDNNVYDIKLISTLGLTNNDLNEIQKLDENFSVYGSHSKDVEISAQNNNSSIIKIMEVSDIVNKNLLLEGRLPQGENEIVVESEFLTKMQVNIGDYITLKLADDDKTVKTDKMQIVGTIINPTFVLNGVGNLNRGNTTIGNGSINFYAGASKKFFDMDYYTEIYITVKNKYQTNSDEYNNLIESSIDKIESIQEEREKARFDEIVETANKEIDKKESEARNQFDTAKQQLDDAEAQLEAGENKIKSSETVLKEAKQKLDSALSQIKNGSAKLEQVEAQLDQAKAQLDSAVAEINNRLAPYGLTYEDVLKITDVKKAIEEHNFTRDEIISLIPTSTENYDQIVEVVNYIYDSNNYQALENFLKGVDREQLISLIPTTIDNYDEVVDFVRTVSIESIRDRIVKYLINNNIDLDSLQNAVNLVKQIENGYKTINQGYQLVNQGKAKLNQANSTYNKYIDQYQKGKKKLEEGKREYNDGLNLYNTKYEEYNARLTDFEENIKQAREKANSIDRANWHIFDRKDNNEYASYLDDANSVENLAVIFPTIFFAVAVFISLLSMSRMAIEDRSEIGTLKSLGFSNMAIRSKYLLFAFMATAIGGILGSFAGTIIIPQIILNAYRMMLEMPIFAYSKNLLPILIGMALSILCICGATLITINGLVKEKTTELLRPKAPLKGKKVFLENIKFIWSRINFSNKIAIRNIFRYKKRIGMTVLGIAGCTMLLLSGYAIRDSIVNVANTQYTEVFKYDDMVYLEDSNDVEELNKIFDNIHITEKQYTRISNVTVDSSTVNLLVPEDENNINKIITLNSKETNEPLTLEDGKVIITSKLAKLRKLKVNDVIEYEDAENNKYSFTISGIAQNYVGNYIFMNKQTYEKNVEKYNINTAYIQLDDIANEDQVMEKLLENKKVLGSVSSQDTLDSINNMFAALDSIVLILVFFAGALAFVVLNNLININISERQREIATLKVLGFNHKEVDQYIIKEQVVITLIGLLIGLIIGTWFGMLIVETVEIEPVEFIKNITFLGYLKAAGFMMLFAIIVNIRVHFTLKKINMRESLQSIE